MIKVLSLQCRNQKEILTIKRKDNIMRQNIRVADININAEFLIDDLRKSILVDNTFHKNIVKCWQEDIRFLIHNGMYGDNQLPLPKGRGLLNEQ